MVRSVASGVTSCSVCGEQLNAKSECLACLVRAALDQPTNTRDRQSVVFGDFEVVLREDGSLWELGHGGMGLTYLAMDTVLRRKIALKVIELPRAARTSDAVRERFLREARAAASLRHQNIAAVFQFGASQNGRHCYYAMELIEGETLQERVHRDGPLNAKLVLEIAIQAVRALTAATGHGLIHRDLKPGNIMLTRVDSDTAEVEVKVIDFGLAKAIAEAGSEMDLTRGGFVGTPNFASPEQFESGPVDVRTDIYSLGVTLWFALTGNAPFAGRTIEEIRTAQKSNALPVEQLEAACIPSRLQSLLKSMLAFEPAARPNMQELAGALRRCSAKEIALEIAHVLFIDIVGYSKLSINDQQASVDDLTQIVRSTEHFQKADAADRLIKIAAGDGMALVFYTSPEAPVRCAIEIGRALKSHPKLQIRSGIHSGPVSGVVDVTGRANLTGSGLNIASRVMGCGDAGHILLSKHTAEDLGEFEQWRPLLHDLGTIQVKHGVKLHVVNLYSDKVGRSDLPRRFQLQRRRTTRVRWLSAAATIVLAAVLALTIFLFRNRVPSSQSVPDKSIAVLPLENLSDDKQNALFTDGIHDDILTSLAKISDLKVIGRRSVVQYRGSTTDVREIRQALRVAYVLEGTVRKAGDKLRVTAQLIDTRTAVEKWAEKYDRDVADIFAIQNDISEAIADQLKAVLTPEEKATIETAPTKDIEAYDLYIRARSLLHALGTYAKQREENRAKAKPLLEAAIARDPKFVLAYCLLAEADCGNEITSITPNSEQIAGAKAALDTALKLAPESGEVHLQLGFYYYVAANDSDRAKQEFTIAARKLPNSVQAQTALAELEHDTSNWRQALQHSQRGVELDPRDPTPAIQLAAIYRALRRYDEAEKLINHMVPLVPFASSAWLWWNKGALEIARGDTKAAMDACNSDPLRHTGLTGLNYRIAHVLLLERRYDEAAAIIESMEQTARANGTLDNTGFSLSAIIEAYKDLAVARRAQGRTELARAAFELTKSRSVALHAKIPGDPAWLGYQAICDAGLGNKEAALRELQQVEELWPKWQSLGPVAAIIYLWCGDRQAALNRLEAVVDLPDSLKPGDLKLNPQWDELRGEPRFQRVIARASKPITLD